MVSKKFVLENRLTFSSVVNMLKVVSSAMVSFTHVDARQNQDVPKRTQNSRFSFCKLWFMMCNMGSVLVC